MTREEYKANLIRLTELYPTMGVSDMARLLNRSAGWIAELLREARKEREAEMWSMLSENTDEIQ